MSSASILGLHHVSAICGPAQENLDFYAGVLGLRLIKLTVNYDDPTTYHLYYGDGCGTPGTVLTFFPYPNGYPGRPGVGQATVTALAVPPGTLKYWSDRLKSNHIDVESQRGRSLDFTAPDGLKLRLIADPEHLPTERWSGSPVPSDYAIGALRSVVLEVESPAPTRRMLGELLGLHEIVPNQFGFADGPATIDIHVKDGGTKGRSGRGGVHHVAFRVEDETAQCEIRQRLVEAGIGVSAVANRTYFKSIYFRDPGGVLLEVATELPGFDVDEPIDRLGLSLKLPVKFEPYRIQIEKSLPELRYAVRSA